MDKVTRHCTLCGSPWAKANVSDCKASEMALFEYECAEGHIVLLTAPSTRQFYDWAAQSTDQ